MSDTLLSAPSPASPPPPGSVAAAPDEPRPPHGRPPRTALPSRRSLVSIGFEFEGHKYHLGVGPYPNGRVGEVWLATAKASSALEALARDVAIVISVALQSGMTVATFQAAVQRRPDGGPTSLLGTVLDLIVTEGFA